MVKRESLLPIARVHDSAEGFIYMLFTAINTTYQRRKVKSLCWKLNRCVDLMDDWQSLSVQNVIAIVSLLVTHTGSLHYQILWQLFHRDILLGCVALFAFWAPMIIHQVAGRRALHYLAKGGRSTLRQNYLHCIAVRCVLTRRISDQTTLTHQLPSR